jgi:hypothetical protein
MDENRKSNVRRAVENYYKRQEPQPTKNKIAYHKPEKEVEAACLKWMRSRHWDVRIYESKSTYDPRAGRYISQSMKAGNADCMGNLPDGVAVIVEFKAPGRLSNFASSKNYRQAKFVQDKIMGGCFACVTDSVERLQGIYMTWAGLRAEGDLNGAKLYLLGKLPTQRPKKVEDSFL